MRVLVTGAAGFVGRHLAAELAGAGHSVVAFDLEFTTPVECAETLRTGDLTDPKLINRIVAEEATAACIHLGAISFVPAGDANPDKMLSVNIGGTVNVLDAYRNHSPSARLLIVSTSRVYGEIDTGTALTEDSLFTPLSIYALSKTAADTAALAYARRYGMYTMTARPGNHTGPGQADSFAVPAFAKQIKAIAEGKTEPVLVVGNLDSVRDFTDVRDVVRAYRLLIEKAPPGMAYNISSQKRVSMREIVDILCARANTDPAITVDKDKFRPTETSPLLDITRIREATGWSPQIELSETLRDILEEY